MPISAQNDAARVRTFAVAGSANAATLISEGFSGSLAGLTTAGWFITNLSSPAGITTWFRPENFADIFAAQDGSANYIAANYNSATASRRQLADRYAVVLHRAVRRSTCGSAAQAMPATPAYRRDLVTSAPAAAPQPELRHGQPRDRGQQAGANTSSPTPPPAQARRARWHRVHRRCRHPRPDHRPRSIRVRARATTCRRCCAGRRRAAGRQLA